MNRLHIILHVLPLLCIINSDSWCILLSQRIFFIFITDIFILQLIELFIISSSIVCDHHRRLHHCTSIVSKTTFIFLLDDLLLDIVGFAYRLLELLKRLILYCTFLSILQDIKLDHGVIYWLSLASIGIRSLLKWAFEGVLVHRPWSSIESLSTEEEVSWIHILPICNSA